MQLTNTKQLLDNYKLYKINQYRFYKFQQQVMNNSINIKDSAIPLGKNNKRKLESNISNIKKYKL
jgi:hypothetical protein